MIWRRRGDHRVANPARQFFANVPDNFEPTRHGRAIGLTHANATAVLLANPQSAFDLMWERTIETAVRSYGTKATRAALRELGFTDTLVPSGY
jgi:hypothetical protein